MSPEEFAELGNKIYGYGWGKKLSKEIKYTTTMVSYWKTGKFPVPILVQRFMEKKKIKKDKKTGDKVTEI